MAREGSLPYLVFILGLSLYAIAALAIGTFVDLDPETRRLLEIADVAVCVLFFVDFVVTLVRSENRLRYLLTWGWLDLLSSVPAIDALRWTRTARVLRILRVLRAVRATRVLAQVFLRHRAESAAAAAGLVTLLLVVVGAASVLHFETAPAASIRTAEDALWWAATTITTVGYGDKVPLSTEGRVVAVLLMFGGVGLFAVFSGFLAAWFLGRDGMTAELPSFDDRDRLERIEEELRALRLALGDRSSRGEPP